MGSTPATLEAAKAADFCGCLPGHVIEIADGEQAHVQAEMKGTPTWICFPPDQRPVWWAQAYPNMKKPVRRLLKALYGHPDAGTYRAEQCQEHTLSVGFHASEDGWVSCYWHDELRMFLRICVDDCTFSGPDKSIKQGWALLRKGLVIEPEARIEKNGIAYLGCAQRCFSLMIEPGRMATVMWSSSTVALLNIARLPTSLLRCGLTPHLFSLTTILARPLARRVLVLSRSAPWCHHITTPTSVVAYPTVAALVNKPKVRPVETCDEPQQGELHDVASQVLMKVLWAARPCRRDLLRAVHRLATCVAKWTSERDFM